MRTVRPEVAGPVFWTELSGKKNNRVPKNPRPGRREAALGLRAGAELVWVGGPRPRLRRSTHQLRVARGDRVRTGPVQRPQTVRGRAWRQGTACREGRPLLEAGVTLGEAPPAPGAG